MAIITLFIISQSFFSNIENKQVYHPEVQHIDSMHSYNVLHYLIDLDLPMTSRYLAGAVTIACRSNQNNLNLVDLHLLGLNVDSLKVDGVGATFNHNGETLLVNLPSPMNIDDSFDIMVGYSGTCTGSMGYLWFTNIRTNSYTLGCPFSTRRWMPCYDRMWDKADYGVELNITAPDSFYVCAVGEFLGADTVGGQVTFHWKHDYPISPYLIHFASSIFVTYSDWYHPAGGDSVEIKYFIWPDDTAHAPIAFQYTTEMMYFFDSLYGAYPFERYGMDILNQFYYAGMEHQTLATIYRTGFLNNAYYLMAHEMSHMWWGDMVTCCGWENVWLNEGFATYSDCLYYEFRQGHQAFINRMIQRKFSYMGAENSHPRPLYDTTLADLFCTGHDYHKGSWVLHMIRYLCGSDSTWLRYMATYRDSFAFKNATTDDANRILNQVLGGNYDWFFDEWVYNMGYPNYEVVWVKVFESPNWRLILDVDQIQTIGPSVFHMPLPIGVNYAVGDTILTLNITQAPQHFEFILPGEPQNIDVDPETWILGLDTIIQGVAEQVKRPVRIEHFRTIGRAINLQLSEPVLIKIYDITGRLIYRATSDFLDYKPASTGIYHVMVDGEVKRAIVVR